MVPPVSESIVSEIPDWGIKLARADEHMDAVEAGVKRWVESEPYRITDELDPESGYTVVYAEQLSDPSPNLAAIIGDAIQNLRSCLDYIALALSERNYGGVLPENLAGICHFPISGSEKKFAATRRSCVPHIAREPLAIIERAQPYRSQFGVEGSQLLTLKALSDFDKHRGLPLVIKAGKAYSGAIPDSDLGLYLSWALQKKTELWRYKATMRPGASLSEMDMYPDLTPEICFGDIAPAAVVRRDVTLVLHNLFAFVGRDIVVPLKPYLE